MRATSRRSAQFVRYVPLASGLRSSAAALRALRGQPPRVEDIVANAEFLGKLGDRRAGMEHGNGLSFEFRVQCLRGLGFIDTFWRLVVQKSSSPQFPEHRGLG